MFDRIKGDILDLKDEMISLRRDFHQHPELGMEERRTAQKVGK
jgi:hippurate hydrolase